MMDETHDSMYAVVSTICRRWLSRKIRLSIGSVHLKRQIDRRRTTAPSVWDMSTPDLLDIERSGDISCLDDDKTLFDIACGFKSKKHGHTPVPLSTPGLRTKQSYTRELFVTHPRGVRTFSKLRLVSGTEKICPSQEH